MKDQCLQNSDKKLVRAVCAGQTRMFDELLNRYCPAVTAFAASRMGNSHEAEDIAQETFLRAYKNIDAFDDSYSFKSWLFTIAYRLMVSHYRRKKPERLTERAAKNIAASETQAQRNEWLWDYARSLGPDSFTALWLRYREDMTTEKIARVMGKSAGAVRVLLHRSRTRLARHIADRPGSAQSAGFTPLPRVLLERTK